MERNARKVTLFIILSIVTLLIVISSVYFCARKFDAYCYNSKNDELDTRICAFVKNEIHNKNIFLVSETDLTQKLEDEFAGIDVVNIERIFPDTVKVNYCIPKDYVVFQSGGKNYYTDSKCRITAIDEGERATGKSFIRLTTQEEAKPQEDYLYSGEIVEYLAKIVSCMERMGFVSVESVIAEVDVTKLASDELWIKTRMGSEIRMLFPNQNFDGRFNQVISVIDGSDDSLRVSGVWTVTSDLVTHSK